MYKAILVIATLLLNLYCLNATEFIVLNFCDERAVSFFYFQSTETD
jgi:hypothetical protein